MENRNAVSTDTGNAARLQHSALRRQVIVDQLLLINKETLTWSIAVLSEKDIFSSLSNLLYFFLALLKCSVSFLKLIKVEME